MTESGVVLYDLGRIEVPDGSVIIKVVLLEQEDNFSIAVSGVLTLRSERRTYVMDIPCAVAINITCFRVW